MQTLDRSANAGVESRAVDEQSLEDENTPNQAEIYRYTYDGSDLLQQWSVKLGVRAAGIGWDSVNELLYAVDRESTQNLRKYTLVAAG